MVGGEGDQVGLEPAGGAASRAPYPMNKLLLYHPRIWISAAAGTAAFFLFPIQASTLSRVLVAWNCGVDLFLILIYWWMKSLNAEQICLRYIEEDETAPFILAAVTLAALLSVVAIVGPLTPVKPVSVGARAAHFSVAALTFVK